METVGKQVQVVSGLGVGGPVGPVGPVGGDLHHHHHPHPHALPPHPHSHPHGHPHGSHGHSLATSNPGRGQPQPPTSHNQHVPARSTPVQLHSFHKTLLANEENPILGDIHTEIKINLEVARKLEEPPCHIGRGCQ
ncbi:PREDICTED: LIM domain-containing protein A-like [Cyphomyrmex costatus]|uniref:LIM domain-containing protein A-like n=1 Tax=Cyphomyrmex costatus TaxID=456900 RepID=UPI0008521DBC|nr:PREDICTED: LIM domain-containing protein A-like [Cyphomyrmex costatus]